MATDIADDDLLAEMRAGSELLLDESEIRSSSELLLEHREIVEPYNASRAGFAFK